ncbi:MAG: hypothetical protein Q4D54_06315 [Eubacteriales bacterium]|nr:hypothetical protein [Eubacteriales bacterium]
MAEFYLNEEGLRNEIERLDGVKDALSGAVRTMVNMKIQIGLLSDLKVQAALDKIILQAGRDIVRVRSIQLAGRMILRRFRWAEDVISGNTVFDRIAQWFDDLFLTPEERAEIQAEIDQLLASYTYTDTYGVTRVDVYSMSPDEREQLVELYEQLHPGDARNMDTCLQPLADEGYNDDITYIKAIAYTAPEPYRSIYLENVGDINIVDLHYDKNKSQNYKSGIDVDGDGVADGGIRFNIDERWSSDPRTRYNTFFHESGHAIDDLLADGHAGGDFLSRTYEDANGDRLTDALQTDVRNSIEHYVEDYTQGMELGPLEEKLVTAAITREIMTCYDYRYDYPVMNDLTIMGREILPASDMQDILDYTVTSIQTDNSGPSSDIMGGYSGNLLTDRNSSGRPLSYHQAVSLSEQSDGTFVTTNYWVQGSGGSTESSFVPSGDYAYTGKQESEFWAENFSAQMTGNQTELNGIDGRLDTGRDYVVSMIDDIR